MHSLISSHCTEHLLELLTSLQIAIFTIDLNQLNRKIKWRDNRYTLRKASIYHD